MKRSILPLLLPAICLSLFCSTSVAAPALVNTDSNCAFGWISADPLPPAGFPDLILIPEPSGVLVFTNNDNGIYQFQCKSQLDWSQPVFAINLFTGDPVLVRLGSFEQICAEMGWCRNGQSGSLVLDGSTGFPCATPYGLTFEWRQVTTPSGRVSFSCKLPERPVGQE